MHFSLYIYLAIFLSLLMMRVKTKLIIPTELPGRHMTTETY